MYISTRMRTNDERTSNEFTTRFFFSRHSFCVCITSPTSHKILFHSNFGRQEFDAAIVFLLLSMRDAIPLCLTHCSFHFAVSSVFPVSFCNRTLGRIGAIVSTKGPIVLCATGDIISCISSLSPFNHHGIIVFAFFIHFYFVWIHILLR